LADVQLLRDVKRDAVPGFQISFVAKHEKFVLSALVVEEFDDPFRGKLLSHCLSAK